MVAKYSANNRGKRLIAPLSLTLRDEYKIRSFPLRKGDTVQVQRGNFKGVEGTVTEVDSKRGFIYMEGVTREKADGSITFISLHPSKVRITKLNLEDPRRKDILERRSPQRFQRVQ